MRRLGLVGCVLAAGLVAAGTIVRTSLGRPETSGHQRAPTPIYPRRLVLDPSDNAQLRRMFRYGIDAPSPASEVVSHARTMLDGKVWSITTYRNVSDQFCWGTRLGGGGQGMSCRDRAEILGRAPVWATWGSRQDPAADITQWDVVWIEGFARPSVRYVDLVATDCSRARMEPDVDGVFLRLLKGEMLARGAWPFKLEAYGPQHRLLGTVSLPVRPPYNPATKAKGITAPQPAAACAAG